LVTKKLGSYNYNYNDGGVEHTTELTCSTGKKDVTDYVNG
jgi:hypothetical protein